MQKIGSNLSRSRPEEELGVQIRRERSPHGQRSKGEMAALAEPRNASVISAEAGTASLGPFEFTPFNMPTYEVLM